MGIGFVNSFSNRTMGFKLTVIFLSVILIPMLLLAYISYRVIDERLMKEAQEKISIGMKAAWTEYYIHGEQMRYGMLQAASMEEIKDAFRRRDKAYLKEQMTRWKQMRPYVDIWAVVDEKGRVIARLNSDFSGDELGMHGLVEAAISSKEPVISTEIVPKDIMRFEGGEFNQKIYPLDQQGAEKTDVMSLTVVTPVANDGAVIGAIITGDVLNIDSHIAEALAAKIPGLFTTVSANGVRLSTNLIDASGRSIKGTRLPEHVLSGISGGEPVFTEWSMPGMTLVSMFEPIRDHRGRVIGTLDVGISKEKLWAIQKENQRVIALITILGLSISLGAAIVSTYRITRPLKALKEKIGAFASGDMTARVEIKGDADAADELKMLARTFNSMMDEVSRKDEEKRLYLKEIEEKSRKYAELNEELKVTNEELEVAYEETQSQTEELHAINEELKLLNEDLDRKNMELQKANRIITLEEEELKRAKDKLRLIYDSIRDHIVLVNYDLKITEANRYFMDTFGLDESRVIGKNIYSLFGMNPLSNCPVKASIEKKAPVEIETTTPEGKVLRWHAYPMLNGHDGPRMAVVYIKDITEYRLFTNKLIQTDKLSSLGELVSGVAHELNNPLTGIMCFSELLMEDRLNDDVKTKLRKINEASHRCKKIIDNLLTFARWKRPEKKFEDLNKVIRESVELRAYQLKVDNIALELDLDETIPGTMLDENQIHQVFLNLINNAQDAIKEKGESGRIRITSRHMGDCLVVKFEDNGKGMPADIASKIFDPFFTTKGVGKGTGLGLSISYGIINEHGGNIYATSTPGVGTTFVVELPVIEKKKTPSKEEVMTGIFKQDRLMARAKGLRALILDDEPIVLDLLNESLTSSGFLVDKASTGDAALAMLGENDYDLIISDIKMPGMDGKVFYREVRTIRPESVKKIVFISGDSVNKETQDFLEETGNVYLKKPFTVDELNEVISRMIFRP